MKTIIIAEAGVNHNGDIGMAKKMIDVASAAGADIVKFQSFSADRLVTMDAGKAEYQKKATNAGETQYEMIRSLELTRDNHKELMDYCRLKSIEFLSTPFDLESIDLLVELGLNKFKIPSGEITNLPYLRYIGHFGKPVILSTGMSNLDEIKDAIDILEKAGMSRKNITVLHCCTEYPAPMMDVNLKAMLTIRDTLDISVGYSDHTLGIEVDIAAVALGASIIEKHFTLDRKLPGPDHGASIEPDELERMVLSIRNIEQALGDGIKRPCPGEVKNIPSVRKSLVASCDINSGEKFNKFNVSVKRPGTGISPMRWEEVMGSEAKRNFKQGELIEL